MIILAWAGHNNNYKYLAYNILLSAWINISRLRRQEMAVVNIHHDITVLAVLHST